MSSFHILILLVGYFTILLLVSILTNTGGSNADFFKANKKSPWYLVAFGMIGASLSGVTFISVPGWVETSSFSYFQVVLGYTVGYAVVGTVLLPLYYKLQLTSIYTYLEDRFGNYSYKTGASFFLISRIIGASFRLYLVASVLQYLVFNNITFLGFKGIPFYITVSITILLIWLYTFKSGIKTIIWTDTLQTLFMLVSVGVAIYVISDSLKISSTTIFEFISDSEYSKIFFFEDWKSGDYFFKQFFSGVFIAIVMTGLDQDMMQKNLSCRNKSEAQKNMFWFTIVLTVVNLIFLILGLLLTVFVQKNGIDAHKDQLFPIVAVNSNLGVGIAIFFLLGLMAAAYSSADSALTSLTTSFSIDILDIEKKYSQTKQVKIRKNTHIIMSLVLALVIIIFKYVIVNDSVISKLFTFAGYTYGPLLGLYAFGLFTKRKVFDKLTPFIAVATPFIGFVISYFLKNVFNYETKFSILILNGALCFIGLLFSSWIEKNSSLRF